MKLSKRETVLLAIAVIALAGFLYYNYFYKPYETKATMLETSINDHRQQLNREKLEKAQLDAQAAQIEQLTSELEGQIGSIPVGVDEARLLVFLEECLTGSGGAEQLSTNRNIQFIPETQSLGYCQISRATVTLSTSYDNLLTILKTLEEAPYRNRILNMTVTSKVNDQDLKPVDTIDEPEPGDDETDDEPGDEPDDGETEAVIEPEMVRPYLLEVHLSIEFFSFPGPVDPNAEYPFMDGVYSNPDLFPIPEPVPWYYPEPTATPAPTN